MAQTIASASQNLATSLQSGAILARLQPAMVSPEIPGGDACPDAASPVRAELVLESIDGGYMEYSVMGLGDVERLVVDKDLWGSTKLYAYPFGGSCSWSAWHGSIQESVANRFNIKPEQITIAGTAHNAFSLAAQLFADRPQLGKQQAALLALRFAFSLDERDGIFGGSDAALAMGWIGYDKNMDLLNEIATQLARFLEI